MTDHYGTVKTLLQERDLQAAEREALRLLQANPFDAQAWVFLGEALLYRGYGSMAAQSFARGQLLDPQAAWADAANAALQKAPAGDWRADIDAMLDVPRVTVAAAILARDEIRCIERCLRSIEGAVDEIVVIDTGSTDGTREAAERFPGVNVVPFEWCDDFAAARNAGLLHIKSDWVIWVDADETLFPEDKANIRAAAGLFGKHDFPIVLNGGVYEQMGSRNAINYSKSRMFPLKSGYRFYGRVHEQIVNRDDASSKPNARKQILIRFYHDGYEPTVLQKKGKLERNLRLLRMMIDEEPNNPAWSYFFGRETLGTGDSEGALKALYEAVEKAEQAPAFSRETEVWMLIAAIQLQNSELDKAVGACRRVLHINPEFPDALLLLAQIELKQSYKLVQQAEKRLRQAKASAPLYRGVADADPEIGVWKSDFWLAEVARLAGKPAQALPLYAHVLKCNPDHADAKKRLAQIKDQRILLNRMDGAITHGVKHEK